MSELPEAKVAAAVVKWLRERGWQVYQEVAAGPIADIVATQQHGKALIAWIIECKVQLGLAVIDQALHWKLYGMAHFVSVATPRANSRAPRHAINALLVDNGIGQLEVEPSWSGDGHVLERLEPAFFRGVGRSGNSIRDIRTYLREEQKTHVAAGTANGGHWSDFKDTCQKVSRYVHEHPGTTLKALLDAVDTHYASKASARSTLAHWIEKGKVPGVRIERSGRALLLQPDDAPAQQLAMGEPCPPTS